MRRRGIGGTNSDAPFGTVLGEFAAPATFVWGLTMVGGNLVSGDATSGTIYLHDGVSDTILSTITGMTSVSGVSFDGTDLYTTVRGNKAMRRHVGFSASVASSEPRSFDPGACLRVGTSLYVSSRDDYLIYEYNATTWSYVRSFVATPTIYNAHGLTVANGNLIVASNNPKQLIKFDGLTTTILESVPIPGLTTYGVTFDGTNLLVADPNDDLIRIVALGE